MLAPFQNAASMIVGEVTMRGEPNSVVSHFASKPADETSEVSGSVLPPKLGDGQLERNVAASSLPAFCIASEPVPRRLTTDLNCTRVSPAGAGASGAFASTKLASRQACSSRRASRQGIH